MIELFLFAQGGIFEGAFARGERSTMRAMHQSVSVQNFEILANRNLGSIELVSKFGDQNPSLSGQLIENGAAAFFVEHRYVDFGSVYGFYSWLSFYSVVFRWSTSTF